MTTADWLDLFAGIGVGLVCLVAPLLGYLLVTLFLKFLDWLDDDR